ncbi:hypothetical protein P7C73_g1424, partial [Tremellales sp. Uapishka_1]
MDPCQITEGDTTLSLCQNPSNGSLYILLSTTHPLLPALKPPSGTFQPIPFPSEKADEWTVDATMTSPMLEPMRAVKSFITRTLAAKEKAEKRLAASKAVYDFLALSTGEHRAARKTLVQRSAAKAAAQRNLAWTEDLASMLYNLNSQISERHSTTQWKKFAESPLEKMRICLHSSAKMTEEEVAQEFLFRAPYEKSDVLAGRLYR